MREETSFLNASEQSLLDEIKRYISHAKVGTVALNAKQFKTWSGILRKAKKSPTFDYADGIDTITGKYMGADIVNLAARKAYTKRNVGKLNLEVP